MGEIENWKLGGEKKRTIQSYLSSREIMITEMDCLSLMGQLASGELYSREVTMAFCHRAAVT
ncbi:uncharacterized protein N7458_001180 [Penicillium daleae]|uniref:Uncharacterized protein n=1 Tax=Penicillium daleae TaxID=63821 RepID=A0AAD6CAN6_9EURO|nr:uncharacterized protein N7458_001180 [Penicillium daleae]KAJ5459628.1 hypothetical protein N7458_001180 [Penicillium daleae]